MNFAYVLVSDSSDIYYEQLLVSLISLKHWNPDAKVFLACDDVTKNTLVGLRSRHEKYVDEVKIVNFSPDKGKHYRSRYLKTKLRELFAGDILYLDSDTIICDKIDESVFTDDIMGVDDKHQLPQNHSMWPEISQQIEKAGFSTEGIEHYINGGVLWMKDSEQVYVFCSLWHSLWLQSYDRGVCVDQPSLNESNKRLGGVIALLPGEYNCQISATLKFFYNAKVIHCFATTIQGGAACEAAYCFLNVSFYENMKNGDVLENDLFKIYNAKTAFDGGETILLGKQESDVYRNLSRTNLYGFIRCLFNSQRGRWLFNLMDKIVETITLIFWKK